MSGMRTGRRRRFCSALVGCVLLYPSGTTRAQTVRVSDALSCPRCAIELIPIARVGSATGPTILSEQATIMSDQSGRLYVFSSASPGTLLVFEEQGGRFLRTFGRLGKGPGEFSYPAHIVPMRDGSNLIIDLNQRRATHVSANLGILGVFQIPFYFNTYARLNDGTLIVNAIVPTPQAIGYPYHVLNDSLRHTRSFGPDSQALHPGQQHVNTRLLAPARAGGFWSASVNELAVERRDTAGRVLQRLTRNAPWFPPWTERSRQLMWGAPPQPEVAMVHEDSAERLWVLSRVPDAKWAPSTFPGHVATPDTEMSRFFDTIIEVWSTSGQLLASHRYGEYFFDFRNGSGLVYSPHEDAQGNPYYTVWRLNLNTNGGGDANAAGQSPAH